MKPTQSGISTTSTIEGRSIAMGIRVEDMAKVMGVLTDLYSDKLRAVIREYATNAFDAHVEAGVKWPIEVTLPNPMNPILSIRDYGHGLDEQSIVEVYSQYGRSTKENTNSQVGMLGLGCKSALTYCSGFVVTSVKDGQQISLSVSRNEQGVGEMTIADRRATDEPNGTTVQVPVPRHDHEEAKTKAKDFFSVWTPGTVLVNGAAPERFEGLRLTDDLYILTRGQSQVVMGNVAYPAPSLRMPNGVNVLAFVPIGAVAFPPSREALQDSPETRRTLANIRDRYTLELPGAIQRAVNACDEPAAALAERIRWQRYVPFGNDLKVTFKGRTMPGRLPAPAGLQNRIARYSKPGAHTHINVVPVEEWPHTVFVHGFTPEKFTAIHRRKLDKIMAGRGIDTSPDSGAIRSYVMLRDDWTPNEWIDANRVVSYEEVRKLKLDPKPRVPGAKPARIPGSFDIWRERTTPAARGDDALIEREAEVAGDDLRQNVPLFYMRGNWWTSRPMAFALAKLYPKFTLVYLPQNRLAKFQRDAKAAKWANDGIREGGVKWAATVTDDEKRAMAFRERGIQGTLAALDPAKVDDPALKAAARIARLDVDDHRSILRLLRNPGPPPFLLPSEPNPLDKYLLFNANALTRDPDHVYHYLNAAFAA
jgi:hypothetical protein